jgi:hypothetical protein
MSKIAKKLRKEIHTLLVASVDYLLLPKQVLRWRNRSKLRYICYAIESAQDNRGSYDSLMAQKAIRAIIHERMGDAWCLEEWVHRQGIRGATHDMMQEYRHRWLQSLIKEFSS